MRRDFLHADGEGWAFTPAAGDDPAILALNNYSYTGEGTLVELESSDSETFLTSAVLYYDEPEPLEIRLTGENEIHHTSTTDGIAQETGIYCRSTADDGLTPRGVLQADTDCDGEVTAADAVLILRYIIGLVASLPVEPA